MFWWFGCRVRLVGGLGEVLRTDMSDPVARRMAFEAPAARSRRPLTVRQPPSAEQREVDSWSCASG